MKHLSIFVDESGDFGPYSTHSPYYIITMVFHDQNSNLTEKITKLDNSLKNLGYGDGQAIHTEPLIRREAPYQSFTPNERRHLFTKLYYFALDCDIAYKTFLFKKNQFSSKFELAAKMAKELSQFIQNQLLYFQAFDKITLYYDNGQHELNKILNMVFASHLSSYEMRKVIPSDYRLFQVADLICTLELIKTKCENNSLSNSEEKIFHSKRELKKDFLRKIDKKSF